ncbi:hypothetical protein G3M48_009107 [Beauveria asiatica]|uniref:ABC transporter n=1 Tax=Beauveria asiatica TaxID=1069075 RepID=A0AAW0S3J9_9HYPO
MQSNNSCTIHVERVFGPFVSSTCLGGFDFTLVFEETILTILPLSQTCKLSTNARLAIALANTCLQSSYYLGALFNCEMRSQKSVTYGTYVVLQILLLALWTQSHAPKTASTLAALSVTLVTSLFFLYLSYLEHTRSVRPSTLLTLYLGLSTLLDLARVRTLFYPQSANHLAAVFLAGFCVKVVMFALELYEKRRLLRPKWQDSAPEATSSTYSRALFIWLNSLMVKGFRSSLTVDTLTPIDGDLKASEPSSLLDTWNRGYGLIAAYALAYIGIAVAYAVYELKVYRAITLFRGSLVSVIFNKTLRVSSHAASDAETMTLMSADIDRIGESMEDVHELYAGPLELGLALWLLYRFLGIAMSASTAFIIVYLVGSLRVATIAGDAQVPWLEAIETRLDATSGALGALKGIRMTGVSGAIVNVITRLRQREIRSSLRYRLWNIFLNAGFYVSSTFAPLWGFGVFILLARSRNTQTLTEPIIFPALTLYELSDQPTVNIPDALEQAQTILNSESKVSGSNEKDESSTTSSQEKHAVVEENVQADVSQKNDLPSTDTIFTARNATAGYSSEKEPVLKALTFDVTKFKTTMVIGPVGCGKSTLLRLLLGEVPETSWIFRGTIRDNIVGLSTWDEPRYKSVVQACCLSADFDILPNGDRTEVGTRGSHLSGGQQMRVTLARALFSGEDLDLESSEDVDSTNGEPELDLELPDEILEHMAAAEVENVNGGRRVGDLKIYAYFIGVAGWWYMVLYVFLYSAFVFGLRFPSIWLQWWANANESHPNERIRYWLGVYATIAATAFLGSVVSDYVFQLKIVPKMMVEFHRRLLTTTMNATTRFITSKDTGTILNRFSQDLNLIDSELPNIRGGSTGFLGVALFNIVPFSQTLQLVVTEWTHLETAIGAVSRVRSFVLGTEREDAVGETEDLPSEWPKSGSITFTNVSASYEASPRPVLQDINLEIKSGERLAICGRTGSDKSSCVSCLFRMLDPDTGSILIDGVDIAKAPRGELRMRLNTVPQQPFFLYGSVRENIDPLSKATDERLIEVLKTVQLWGMFEEHGGLDEDMDSDLLSHGQQQLFCLGRAMVCRGRILVLDDVDADTDDMMHRIIHDEFEGQTVIAIAHKLDTILDFDRIVFLDKGKIAEIGAPRELLATEGSLFRAQYESAAN